MGRYISDLRKNRIFSSKKVVEEYSKLMKMVKSYTEVNIYGSPTDQQAEEEIMVN
jgi:hypothetical protein